MLLTPSGTHPCSGRAGGSDVLNHDGGHLNPEAGGGLIYLGTLGFPSSSQRDCQEQTRFVTPAALRPRGWAQASWQHLVAAPANPPNSKRVSFPLLMPSCSEGQPSPAGTAFPPGAAAGSIANAEPKRWPPAPERVGVSVCLSKEKSRLVFWGHCNPSSFHTVILEPKSLRPSLRFAQGAGRWWDFRSVSPPAGSEPALDWGWMVPRSPQVQPHPGFGSEGCRAMPLIEPRAAEVGRKMNFNRPRGFCMVLGWCSVCLCFGAQLTVCV